MAPLGTEYSVLSFQLARARDDELVSLNGEPRQNPSLFAAQKAELSSRLL